ncbi:hypothetical protein LshimejAT787_1002820 [Lyophyllum shimeji]|uniref:Uncharacterized protein n=1 Tax=Lyophyllum shimeji TaxID=47721 RepID=A0A9P3UQX0_LYOSH|nr:hypothetical protein LshimejAT787_1002820 [Lyophyllum shimeji]
MQPAEDQDKTAKPFHSELIPTACENPSALSFPSTIATREFIDWWRWLEQGMVTKMNRERRRRSAAGPPVNVPLISAPMSNVLRCMQGQNPNGRSTTTLKVALMIEALREHAKRQIEVIVGQDEWLGLYHLADFLHSALGQSFDSFSRPFVAHGLQIDGPRLCDASTTM